MKDFLIWTIYNFLFAIGYTLLLPKFLLRMWKRGGYRKDFMQRFAVYDDNILKKTSEKSRIWIHAVSVGEIFIALHFIKELRKKRPETSFILSTTTSTGHAQAESKLLPDDILIYYPTDLPSIVRRAIHRLNPAALILTECEMWPNILRQLNRANIPVFVVNGRISKSSYHGYQKVRFFFRRAVAWIDMLVVQSRLDQQRLISLGTPPEKIFVEGSAKYDVATADAHCIEQARRILLDAKMNPDAEIIVAGSTWPGEEEIILDIFQKLRKTRSKLQLILVPRHMERREEVENCLRQYGITYIKRTDMPDISQPSVDTPTSECSPAILLADTTGELKSYYSIATVVFIGKSMGENHGGQNPIEPAAFGKPIIVGSHMENFPGVMDDFYEQQALIQVKDPRELEEKLNQLLDNSELRKSYGQRAGKLIEAKRGVVSRSIDHITKALHR